MRWKHFDIITWLILICIDASIVWGHAWIVRITVHEKKSYWGLWWEAKCTNYILFDKNSVILSHLVSFTKKSFFLEENKEQSRFSTERNDSKADIWNFWAPFSIGNHSACVFICYSTKRKNDAEDFDAQFLLRMPFFILDSSNAESSSKKRELQDLIFQWFIRKLKFCEKN